MLTRLDVINEMLATLGELPINSLEEGHPMVPTALRVLNTASIREQSKSWWFNKELTDLEPDVTGTIYLPNDTLRVDPQQTTLNYVQRGRRLYKPYDPSTATKYTFTDKVRCWLIREIPFDDLPVPAQILVSYSAQLDFMKAYDADPNKVSDVRRMYQEASMTLFAEHTRNSDINMLRYRGGVYGGRTEIGVVKLQDALNY